MTNTNDERLKKSVGDGRGDRTMKIVLSRKTVKSQIQTVWICFDNSSSKLHFLIYQKYLDTTYAG